VILSRIHHQVAVFLCGDSVPSDRRKACINAVLNETKSRRVVLSYAIASRVVWELLGKEPVERVDRLGVALAYIATLQKQIQDSGGACPPMPEVLTE